MFFPCTLQPLHAGQPVRTGLRSSQVCSGIWDIKHSTPTVQMCWTAVCIVEVWGRRWLELLPLYLAWMQIDESETQTRLHCSCWRYNMGYFPNRCVYIHIMHTLGLKFKYVDKFRRNYTCERAQRRKLEHPVYGHVHALSVSQSNVQIWLRVAATLS